MSTETSCVQKEKDAKIQNVGKSEDIQFYANIERAGKMERHANSFDGRKML